MPFAYINPEQLYEDAYALAEMIRAKELQLDLLVAIARGGLTNEFIRYMRKSFRKRIIQDALTIEYCWAKP